MSNRPPTEATIRRLERSSGALATRAVARMDDELPWFRAMPEVEWLPWPPDPDDVAARIAAAVGSR